MRNAGMMLLFYLLQSPTPNRYLFINNYICAKSQIFKMAHYAVLSLEMYSAVLFQKDFDICGYRYAFHV